MKKLINASNLLLIVGVLAIIVVLVNITYIVTHIKTSSNLELKLEIYRQGYIDGAINGLKSAELKSKKRFKIHQQIDSAAFRQYLIRNK